MLFWCTVGQVICTVDDIFLQRRTDQVGACHQHWTHWNSIWNVLYIKEGESRRMFSFLIPKPRLSVRLGMHYPSNYWQGKQSIQLCYRNAEEIKPSLTYCQLSIFSFLQEKHCSIECYNEMLVYFALCFTVCPRKVCTLRIAIVLF